MQLILVKELPILLRVKEIRVLHLHKMVEADGETSETRRRESVVYQDLV